MANNFILDQNLCIACNACVMGCQFENSGLEIAWRSVHTFNLVQLPNIGVLNLSMACNHCEEAPCMTNCPANAYSRDEQTGAVIINQDKCIGCKYCTWNCPYDAPQYNQDQGIIEKCHFCNEKLKNGEEPACVSACVTGALKYEKDGDTNYSNSSIGDYGISPSIKIVPKRNASGPKIYQLQSDKEDTEYILDQIALDESKITPQKEWSLLIFTTMIPILFGLQSAFTFSLFTIDQWLYTSLLIIPLLLSTMHLGRKDRAWRAILNIKNSWLSREILFFSAFAATSIGAFFNLIPTWALYLSSALGLLALVSADFLYKAAINRHAFHSSSLTLNGALFFAIFTGHSTMFLTLLSIKAGLYIYRKILLLKSKPNIAFYLRISIGLIIPLLSYMIGEQVFTTLLLTTVILGEFIDRYQFYEEIDIITPEAQMLKDLKVRSSK